MNVGELFIKLGFDVDSQKLKDFQGDLQSGFTSMLKIAGAATGALYALDKFVEGSISSAVAMRNFRTVTGESIDQLQRWQVAATMANTALSVEQVTGSVNNLNKALADITMGKGNAAGIASMLIGDVRNKNSFEVLEELRRNYQSNVARWGLRQTNDMIAELGIDPGMINAIKLTNEEFDNLVNNRILAPESQRRLVELGEAIASAKRDFVLFKDQLAADWSPKLIDGMKQVIPIMTELRSAVGNITDAFSKLPGETQAGAFVGLMVLLAPKITIFTASITALAFALNDVAKYFNGEDSVFGKITAYYEKNFNKFADMITPMFDGPIDQTHTITPEQRRKFWNLRNPLPDDPVSGVDITDVHSASDLDRLLGPVRGGASGRVGNTVTVTNNVEIHSSGDPLAVGQEVQRVLQPSYNRAGAQLNNGPQY